MAVAVLPSERSSKQYSTWSHCSPAPKIGVANWLRILLPTLWLHGEDDPLASVNDARALAATRPEWTFQSRAGVGHLPHMEDPDWTASTISQWLRAHAEQ